jgi:phospholipid transport system substrate-binding protein
MNARHFQIHCIALAVALAWQPCALAREAGSAEPAEVPEAGQGEPVAAETAEPAASAVIDGLHAMLMTVMQSADELGYEGRYKRLEPVILEGFDTPLIVKVILSGFWIQLSEEQKKDFVELFSRLSVATYASRFDGYSGETFVNLSLEHLKKDRLLIRTELQRPGKRPIRLDYLMHQVEDGRWLIISVIANGVNDLSLKRAEYAVVLKSKGYEGLVQDIEAKIKGMESGEDTGHDVVPEN